MSDHQLGALSTITAELSEATLQQTAQIRTLLRWNMILLLMALGLAVTAGLQQAQIGRLTDRLEAVETSIYEVEDPR